jgi:nucleotide-binding universal stress UspA family protein
VKLLIAYDGSNCAEAALDDLVRAGLPHNVEALVFSVAEAWLPPERSDEGAEAPEEIMSPTIKKAVEKMYERERRIIAEAETFAGHAKQRLQKMFPSWTVTAEASYGSPAWEIITRADNYKPDLIVVGSHGQSAISRFFLGSISQKVLTEAASSVRIARGRIDVDAAPSRIIIGYDGSAGANAAVASVLERTWTGNSEFRLITATPQMVSSGIERFVSPSISVNTVAQELSAFPHIQLPQDLLEQFAQKKITPEIKFVSGNPKQVLPDEAEQWGADCIFLGAESKGHTLERFLLGSTAAAVSSRAGCSVEVVRNRNN